MKQTIYIVYKNKKVGGYYPTSNLAIAAILDNIDIMDKDIYPLISNINIYRHRRRMLYQAIKASEGKGITLGANTYYIKEKPTQIWLL